MDLNRKVTEAVRAAVRASVESVTNKDGRIEKVDTIFSEGMKFLEGAWQGCVWGLCVYSGVCVCVCV